MGIDLGLRDRFPFDVERSRKRERVMGGAIVIMVVAMFSAILYTRFVTEREPRARCAERGGWFENGKCWKEIPWQE